MSLVEFKANEDTGTSASSSPPTSLESTASSLLSEILPATTANKLHSIIDDNSSFFSANSFQKITPEHQTNAVGAQGDHLEHSDPQTEHTPSILTDSLPVINTTEDWAAAFGFTGHTDQVDNLTNQRDIKGALETFGYPMNHDNGFSKGKRLCGGRMSECVCWLNLTNVETD